MCLFGALPYDATEWAPGSLLLKWKITVFLLQEVLFALVVHSVGVSEYGHCKAQAQAQESVKQAVFI